MFVTAVGGIPNMVGVAACSDLNNTFVLDIAAALPR
jgi:hypothetical protein